MNPYTHTSAEKFLKVKSEFSLMSGAFITPDCAPASQIDMADRPAMVRHTVRFMKSFHAQYGRTEDSCKYFHGQYVRTDDSRKSFHGLYARTEGCMKAGNGQYGRTEGCRKAGNGEYARTEHAINSEYPVIEHI